MTVAEIQRYLEGATWRLKSQAQFDYILGNLIGISAARMKSKDVHYPSIEQVYPSLFEAEAIQAKEEERAITNSKNNFLQFAMKHNARMKKKEEEV